MRSTSCTDGFEEFTCLIAAWQSNFYDTRGFVQRSAVDYSHVSAKWLY
jgi:hypothetical protein